MVGAEIVFPIALTEDAKTAKTARLTVPSTMAEPTTAQTTRKARRAALESAYPRYSDEKRYDSAIEFALRNPRGLRALADASVGWIPL